MKKLSPYIIITASFLITILIGSILLSLPIAKQGSGSIKYIDAFVLSASAVTITGLTPIANLAQTLSLFGKIVLIFLVQIGGLSIVTLSVFVMVLIGSNIGISNRILIKETFNQDSLSGMVKLVVRIVIYTLIIQTIGFLINLIVFLPDYDFWTAVGISAFHAISSFNNAGFDLLGSMSLISYSSNILLNINTSLLIMLGGLGFIVVNDLLKKKSYKKLSIHSKIVLKVNLFLWMFGTIAIKLTETLDNNYITWLQSFFMSVTARTAGFSTIVLTTIRPATLLVLIVLMFIGGSPASTSGGIKTTTIYSLYKSVTSYASGKTAITSGRKISKVTKEKATVILTFALFIITLTTLLLLIIENISLEQALFKVVSSFGNVGLTIGLTPILKTSSKIIISVLMIVGRVGILTIISIFNLKWYKHGMENIDYVEENIMIG